MRSTIRKAVIALIYVVVLGVMFYVAFFRIMRGCRSFMP